MLAFILRSGRFAVGVLALEILTEMFRLGDPASVLLFGGLRLALGLLAALRFGVLALALAFYCNEPLMKPITYDLSAWYAAASLSYALAVAVPAVYGFVAATAGRPLFRDAVFPEG